jgi:copper homeostasis protein
MTACNFGPAKLPLVGRKVLEVIVTSVSEAMEAEQGGADRLEIVRSLDQGCLTPSFDLVEQIVSKVQVPVRAMLREANSMCLSGHSELDRLTAAAENFASLKVDGLVLGFVRNGQVDERALQQILSAAPGVSATFHRAFEHVQSPLSALGILKSFPAVDRVLIRVREKDAGIDLSLAKAWQNFAAPQIQFIVGVGLGRTLLQSVREEPSLTDVHVGRGAREPETPFGTVSRLKVAGLKSALS